VSAEAFAAKLLMMDLMKAYHDAHPLEEITISTVMPQVRFRCGIRLTVIRPMEGNDAGNWIVVASIVGRRWAKVETLAEIEAYLTSIRNLPGK